jgi:hypothetical protein
MNTPRHIRSPSAKTSLSQVVNDSRLQGKFRASNLIKKEHFKNKYCHKQRLIKKTFRHYINSSPVCGRVLRFRLNFFFASKRNEAKWDPFRFVFACSSENKGRIFSLLFASFRFEFFASKRKEKNFASFHLLNFLFASFFLSQTYE